MSTLRPLADNVWTMPFPLRLAGCDLGRNVTVIRLSDGRLIIHSTAPFSADEAKSIRDLGEVSWLFEATNFHDSYAEAGTRAFPGIPYLVPENFPSPVSGREVLAGDEAPEDWSEEIQLIALRGLPTLQEKALFHRPSRTLVVADLVFNLSKQSGAWSKAVTRLVTGIRSHPGQSRLFRHFIRDKEAYRESCARLMELDCQRIVVAHGDPIEQDAHVILRDVLQWQ